MRTDKCGGKLSSAASAMAADGRRPPGIGFGDELLTTDLTPCFATVRWVFPSLGDRRLLPRTLTVRGSTLADAAIMSICDGHSRTRRVLGAVIGTAGLRWQTPLREFVGGGSSNISRRVGLRKPFEINASVSCFFTVQPRRFCVSPKVYPSPRAAAAVLREFLLRCFPTSGYFAGVGQMTNRLAPFVFPANVRLLGNA